MKMSKKVKEYKSGDFIFAKVKGYPAWPARVQRPNGKKYFVYFYGTGETANLPPNMIFDYAENKDKFLTKTVKRRDFNDGVKQIEYDFANNVPLEQVIGVPLEDPAETTANDTATLESTLDETVADMTANDTIANDTADETLNDGAVEDSDETGALVIDEGTKAPTKGRKSKSDVVKTPAKVKEPKTPRGKAKKEDVKDKEENKEKEEEIVSRSGRKIRPKRYMDEQTEENATLPSPAPKRRRGASPATEKADSAKEKQDATKDKTEKPFTQFNSVKLTELEELKAPFKPVDEEKENILIAYLPSGTFIGIKLFQSRPNSFRNEAARLQWDKQAAANAITLKTQLERDQITPESVQAQLVLDLNLTDEEKVTLEKERDTEEKKSRVNFLKTEMKLIELDAKIKTCLCLERADTELCLKLLDELSTLEVKPLMLLKHPTCLETVKRMRAYVGNTPSWDLDEAAALAFSKQAHKIRKMADLLYKSMKAHFHPPEGLSFWEFFSERVRTFKEIVSNQNAGDLLEMVHEPIELDQPSSTSMRSAIELANSKVPPLPEDDVDEKKMAKKTATPAKAKKPSATSTPSKSKRQSSRNKTEEDKPASEDSPSEPQKPEEEAPAKEIEETEKTAENADNIEKVAENNTENISEEASQETPKEQELPEEPNQDVEMAEPEKSTETEQNSTDTVEKEQTPKESEPNESNKESEKSSKENKSDKSKDTQKQSKEDKNIKKDKKSKEDKSDEKNAKVEESDKSGKDDRNSEKTLKDDKSSKDNDKSSKDSDKSSKDSDKSSKDSDKSSKDSDKSSKDSDKSSKDSDKSSKSAEKTTSKSAKEDKPSKESEKRDKRSAKELEKSPRDAAKNGKEIDKNGKEGKSEDKEAKDSDEKEKDNGEPRAKRSRESKKTEPPPPRSPAKRKSKF